MKLKRRMKRQVPRPNPFKRGAPRQTLSLPIMRREYPINAVPYVRADGEEDDGNRYYDVIFSTEREVSRGGYWSDPWIEILGHGKDECRLERMQDNGPVMLEHWEAHVGACKSISINTKEKQGEARIFFSENQQGQEVEKDVVRRIKNKMSVRYIVHEMDLIERGDPKKGTADKYRITDWEVVEISVVAMPADINAVIGGSRAEKGQSFPVIVNDGLAVTEESRSMKRKIKRQVAAKAGRSSTAVAEPPELEEEELEEEERSEEEEGEEEEAPRTRITSVRHVGGEEEEDGEEDTAERDAEIETLCRNNNVPRKVEFDFKRSNMPLRAIANIVNQTRKREVDGQDGAETLVDLNAREAKRFSYARAVEGALRLNGKEKGKFAGFEREIHDELYKNLPKGFDYNGGVLIPLRLLPQTETGVRAMDTKTLTKGSELVGQQPGELIEFLRDESALMKAGATPLVGLTTKIPYPKQKSGMTFYWVAENPPADVTDSDVTMGISWLDPKALAGMNIMSRQLLTQALLDMDALIRREIAQGIALAFDSAGIHGKGGEGVPLGIYKYSDVTVKAMGGQPDLTKLVDMFAKSRKKNALRGRPGLISTPEMAGVLMSKAKFTNGSVEIWSGDFDNGRVAGYPAFATTQVSAVMNGVEDTGGSEHGIIAGNMQDLLMGTSGLVEVTADPYTLMGRAMVRLFAYFMGDTLLRHGESLTVSTGATLT